MGLGWRPQSSCSSSRSRPSLSCGPGRPSVPGCFRMALYLRAAVSARSTTSTRLKMVMTCDRAEPSTVTWVILEGPPRGLEGTGPALPPSAQLGPWNHSLCLRAEPTQVLRPRDLGGRSGASTWCQGTAESGPAFEHTVGKNCYIEFLGKKLHSFYHIPKRTPKSKNPALEKQAEPPATPHSGSPQGREAGARKAHRRRCG